MPSSNAIAPSSSTARFHLFRVSRLTSTLTKFTSASPLAPTLTRKLTFKSFRINTYKKGGEGEGGLFASEHELPTTDHESLATLPKLFRFTLLSKNASANHLESHSCKNKGLKTLSFHILAKKGWGGTPLFHRAPCSARKFLAASRAFDACPDSIGKGSLWLRSPVTSALCESRLLSGRTTSHKSQLTPPRAVGFALAVEFLYPTSNV